MTIAVYHKANPNNLASIRRHGLKYGARGVLSDEGDTARINAFLDYHRPPRLAETGVSRISSVYGYLMVDGRVIDIDNGQQVDPANWEVSSGYARLALSADPAAAFIADLDAHKRAADALLAHESDGKLAELAAAYWKLVRPLSEVLPALRLSADGIGVVAGLPGLPPRYRRPEVLITRDIPPGDIQVLPGK